jgi:hypothetical protein
MLHKKTQLLQLFGKEHESNKLHQKLQRNFDELPENLHEMVQGLCRAPAGG